VGLLQSGMPGSNIETQGRSCDGLGSNVVKQYSVGPIITLHGRITAREHVDRLGNQVHPMIQALFPNNGAEMGLLSCMSSGSCFSPPVEFHS
jgi:hypothetical protein